MNEPTPTVIVPASIYETMAIRGVVPNGVNYDCEVEHPDFGWLPFSASADDPEVQARAIHRRITEGDI